MTISQKTFVLGLGVQKAGTSWLHNYLRADPAADFGALKEYHVWDALTLSGAEHFDMRPGHPLNRTLMRLTNLLKRRGPDNWQLRGTLQTNPAHYFDYFSERLEQPGIHLTGDITPAYAGLSEATLTQIKTGFEQRGIQVKTCLILRDPVARTLSAAKMNRGKRDWREGVPLWGNFDAAVLKYARSATHDLRANYAATHQRIRAVFDADNTYVGLYENMFDPVQIAMLSQFLGVSERLELTSSRVNSSASSLGVTPQTKVQLRDIFAETYDYCAQEFVETRTLWQP